jgi:hypothetical protein
MSDKPDEAMKRIMERLREPFSANDIEWRIQRSGLKDGKPWAMVLAYVTARAIQERLDETCGLFGWKNVYEKGPDGGVICGISIADGEGNFVTKWDGAENTNIEAVKGGISGAFKRAGAVWGIGRYLYNLEATFATIDANGQYSGSAKKNPKDNNEKPTWFKWNPPALPKWALPKDEQPITFAELIDKVKKANAFKHLEHIRNKYRVSVQGMTPDQQRELAETVKLKEDELRGEG